MKTNIKISENGEYCRVKLDGNKFPYIIVGSDHKIILNSIEFPRKVIYNYGLEEVSLDIISGVEELKTILENPELTSDKLRLKHLFNVG